MIIKKYSAGGNFDREQRSTPFIIGVSVAAVIILFFAIGVWIKYFHGSEKKTEIKNNENTSGSSENIAPAGEKILSELQQKIVELNKDNTSLKTELSKLKNQKEKLHDSVSRYSTQLKTAQEEKKDLLHDKAKESASANELKDVLTKKQQELQASQSELIKARDDARQCKNQYNEMYNKLQTVSQSEDDTLNRLLDQMKKTNKELAQMKEKNAQLEQKVKSLQAQINQLTNPEPPK